MAHPPGTSSAPQERDAGGYEVFLNFRGPDVRLTVVDYLYAALIRAGVRVFLDDEEIRKGEAMGGELLSVITSSRVYIPIFSKDYASSEWCLRELEKMVECWRNSSDREMKKVILPIFYDVEVKDLKFSSDLCMTGLQKHKDRLGDAAVKPWEDALKEVAKISGWNLKDHGLYKLTILVVEEVFDKLRTRSEGKLPDDMVNIHNPMKDITKLFGQGSSGDRSTIKVEHPDYPTISNASRIYFEGSTQEMPRRSQSIGDLKTLTVLKINNRQLIELTPSIGELVNLKHLRLRCPQLGSLPESIGKLMLLVELDVSSSGIKVLPDSIGRLESLNELDLSATKVTVLPESIGNLKELKVVNLRFTCMRKLPKDLGMMGSLEVLNASECVDMDGELPEEIGKLSCLRILNLKNTKVSRVPTTINQLFHLKELVLSVFYESQELPKLPTSLASLEVSFLSLDSFKVPDLSNMTNLVTLKLFGGTNDKSKGTLQRCDVQTPEMQWLPRLAKMEKLTLVLSDLFLLPTSLSSLSQLHMLDITYFDPQSLTHLPSSLESLALRDVKSPSEWQLFSTLNNLSTLKLHRCWYEEIQVDSLGQLKNLRLHTLMLEDCEFVRGLANLSCLKELQKLEIVNCPLLVYIQGLEEVEFLRSLSMMSCRSIQRLPDLSSLKKLEKLHFVCCESLENIPDVSEEAPCYLEVLSCKHLGEFRGPYMKQKRKKRKINYA